MQVVRFGINTAVVPISSLTADDHSPDVREKLIGVSRWAETARMLVTFHAAHDSPVILDGEPGSGKKHLAKLIHRSSIRHEGPFVTLALGRADEKVSRTALFGSMNLRSDDALREKGLADLVAGGTLYIDGFTGVSPSLADEIVRLAEREGSSRDGARTPRVLLACNLQNECEARAIVNARASLRCERFHVQPLRERPDDIEVLAVHFIRERCEQLGKEFRKISPEAMKALRAYDWPLNVTELRTLINQVVQLSSPPSIDMAWTRSRRDSRSRCAKPASV